MQRKIVTVLVLISVLGALLIAYPLIQSSNNQSQLQQSPSLEVDSTNNNSTNYSEKELQLTIELTKAQDEIVSLQNQIADLTRGRSELNYTLTRNIQLLQTENSQLSSENSELNATIEQLRTKISTYTNQIDSLNYTINQLKAQITSYFCEIDDLKNAVNVLDSNEFLSAKIDLEILAISSLNKSVTLRNPYSFTLFNCTVSFHLLMAQFTDTYTVGAIGTMVSHQKARVYLGINPSDYSGSMLEAYGYIVPQETLE